MWYVSHSQEKCVTDCEEGQGATCGGLATASDGLYVDPTSCCAAQLSWRSVEFCEAESLLLDCYAGSGAYYRGDAAGSNVCVRDCDPGAGGDAACGGLVEDTYVVLHESAEECCAAEYGWMEGELCAARSDRVEVDKYWPDKINSKCVLDSEEPATDLSVSIYDSIAECCEEEILWLSLTKCLISSGENAALFASNTFFVDWERGGRCVRDCEGPAPCIGLGQVQNYNELYDTEEECCDQIPWVPGENCVFGGEQTS